MTGVVVHIVPMAETESNFLVPNATFLVELAAFALLFYLLAKYVIPPINRAMTNRQDAIRKEFADLDKARADANAAEAEFKAQIADARHEAARIREEAREQGAHDHRRDARAGRVREGTHHRRRTRTDRRRASAGRGLAACRGRHAGHAPSPAGSWARASTTTSAAAGWSTASWPTSTPSRPPRQLATARRTGPADASRRLSGGPRRAGVEGQGPPAPSRTPRRWATSCSAWPEC